MSARQLLGPIAAIGIGLLLVVTACTAPSTGDDELPDFSQDPAQARIVADDLERFWRAWDLAEGNPDARREIFQREYLDAGTAGLQGFVEVRIQDVDQLLAAIDQYPAYYAALRAQTPGMAAAAEPAREAMHKLKTMLPDAVFPDVFHMIGRMNSGGTPHWNGLLIGAEMYGLTAETQLDELTEWHRSTLRPMEELPAIIMHELIHVQQAFFSRASFDTVLGQSIHEGAADFLGELLVGRHINHHIHAWALPREAELWAEFRKVMHGSDGGDWLYGGTDSVERPADLGYFIGYRIVQAYYERSDDKQTAIREIVAMTDPVAFLEASGYAP